MKINTINHAREVVQQTLNLQPDTTLGQAIDLMNLIKQCDGDRDVTLIMKALLEK